MFQGRLSDRSLSYERRSARFTVYGAVIAFIGAGGLLYVLDIVSVNTFTCHSLPVTRFWS